MRVARESLGYPGIARLSFGCYPSVMTSISVKLPEPLLAKLEQAAALAQVSRSELIRSTLEESLAAPVAGSCYDLIADLVGTIHGLPEDLATNPKYMEDFGK